MSAVKAMKKDVAVQEILKEATRFYRSRERAWRYLTCSGQWYESGINKFMSRHEACMLGFHMRVLRHTRVKFRGRSQGDGQMQLMSLLRDV